MTCKIVLWSAEKPNTTITTWWGNFYHQTSQRRGQTMSMYEVNEALAEYGAKYVSADREIYIEFEDEKYSSMLLLKYS